MNIKHNKKRNTAFLYEILIKEVAKTVYSKDNKYKSIVMEVLTHNFDPKSQMAKDYLCYRDLYTHKDLDSKIVDRMISEVSRRRDKIDAKKLFNEQTKLINKINSKLRDDIWENFVPEYRFLGTLYHYFNADDMPTKDKVLLESQISSRLISEAQRASATVEPIDSITYNIYVKKFNEMYGEVLNERQKHTIRKYIFSISDSGVSFKTFLNEEIKGLKNELKMTCDGPNSVCDLEINEKIDKVGKLLDSYSKLPVKEETMIPQILRIQQLLEEMNKEEEKGDG